MKHDAMIELCLQSENLKKFCDNEAEKMFRNRREMMSKYFVNNKGTLLYSNQHFLVTVDNTFLKEGLYSFGECEHSPLSSQEKDFCKKMEKLLDTSPLEECVPIDAKSLTESFKLYFDENRDIRFKTNINAYSRDYLDLILNFAFRTDNFYISKEKHLEPLRMRIDYSDWKINFLIMPIRTEKIKEKK